MRDNKKPLAWGGVGARHAVPYAEPEPVTAALRLG